MHQRQFSKGCQWLLVTEWGGVLQKKWVFQKEVFQPVRQGQVLWAVGALIDGHAAQMLKAARPFVERPGQPQLQTVSCQGQI